MSRAKPDWLISDESDVLERERAISHAYFSGRADRINGKCPARLHINDMEQRQSYDAGYLAADRKLRGGTR